MENYIRQFLEKILSIAGFSNFQIEVKINPSEKLMKLNLHFTENQQKSTKESSLLIGHQGKGLYAWEILLTALLQKKYKENWRVNFDVNNYRLIYEEKLREIARKAARQVILSGRPLELPPMNPRDRRIIHLEIALKSGVTTESEGEGTQRHIIIKPEKF